MAEIEYRVKPDNVTYDELYDLLFKAHAGNREKGLIINPNIHNGKDLEEHLGEGHVCMVAMDGERAVGTLSVKIQKGDRPITKRLTVGYLMNLGVSEDYRRRGIGAGLLAKCGEYAAENGADALVLYVVARNKAVDLYKESGFLEADFMARRTLKQNSIYMIQWLGRHKIPDWVINIYYKMRKLYKTRRYRFQ